MMKIKRILLCILTFLAVFGIFSYNISADEDIITGNSYVLPKASVNKLLSIGVYRGYGMDKQNLGIYMPAGSSFKIKSTNNIRLVIELLNNNAETEKSTHEGNAYEVSGDWVTITADVDSIPFIKTYHSDTYTTIGYEIKDKVNTEDLIIFNKGDNELNYYNNWNNSTHNYSIINSDLVTFLVPREDILKIKNIIDGQSDDKYPFTSIEDMLNWYEDVISRYNSYIGLTSDAQEIYNRDIKMKFFFKPNISGIGSAAYYTWNYICTNSSSISSLLHRGWTALHEMGHGFQSYYTWNPSSEDIFLKEVENNFFAYEEEKKYANDADGSIGILYGTSNGEVINQQHYINKIKNLSNFNELIDDPNGSTSINAGTRLFVFENLFDKISMPNVMPYTLKKYRSIIANGGSIVNADLFGKYFSEASGYNVIPYLNYFKIYPNSVKEEVYGNEQSILYPIAQVFNETTASDIANILNLRGPYSVIENNDVQNYVSTNNIVRNVKFVINTLDSNKLEHKKIYIKNSSNEIVKEEVLSGNEIILRNVPVGMYYIDISDGSIDNIDYLLITQLSEDNSGIAETGSNVNNNENSNNSLTVNIDYTYNSDDTIREQNAEVPDTGIVETMFLLLGMIFVATGIGLLIYKRKVCV